MIRNLLFVLLAFSVTTFVACGDGDDGTDNNTTGGDATGLTTLRSGALSNPEGPPTSGTAAVAEDADGARFVVLQDDFSSDFATGTVEIHLATTGDNLAGAGTPGDGTLSVKVADVGQNGEQSFAVPSGVDDAAFTHVIVWCATANLNFGVAELQ